MKQPYYEFHNPVKVCAGQYALEHLPYELARLGVTRPLVLSDGGLKDAGVLDRVLSFLPEGMEKIVDTHIPPDSGLEVVKRLARVYREKGCGGLVAIGGGSVLDTAKGVRLSLLGEGAPLESLAGSERIYPGRPVPFLAVPTTAGTGSEGTAVAVVSNPQSHVKMEFISPALTPDTAVLDPSLTQKLPPYFTAVTGIDALSHAIEGLSCMMKNPVSDSMGNTALSLISSSLCRAAEKPGDIQARFDMLQGAFLAGVCFSNSMVGGVHAIGHALGSICALPHGAAVSILLPAVMEYNMPQAQEEYGKMLLPFAGEEVYLSTPKENRGREMVRRVRGMQEKLHQLCGLPLSLEETGKVSVSDFPAVADKAVNDGAMIVNPRQMDRKDVLALLKKVYPAPHPSPAR